jgi:hypothetical protein
MIELRQVFEMPEFGAEIEQSQAAAVEEIGKHIEENKKRATP